MLPSFCHGILCNNEPPSIIYDALYVCCIESCPHSPSFHIASANWDFLSSPRHTWIFEKWRWIWAQYSYLKIVEMFSSNISVTVMGLWKSNCWSMLTVSSFTVIALLILSGTVNIDPCVCCDFSFYVTKRLSSSSKGDRPWMDIYISFK